MIVAIANQKGGVAKTTSVICLGGLLAESSSCLVIDLDPQANLSIGLGVEVESGQITTYDVITEQAEVLEGVILTSSGLSLLPADISLAKGETELLTLVGNFLILKERLEPAKAQFKHILIDCPPSLGLLTVNALSAADAVLIPVQCQFFALKGLASLLETIQSIQRRLNPNLKLLGILPTMAEKNTVMTQDVLASLRKRFQDVPVFDPVPKSVKFAESNLAGEPIHHYANEPRLVDPYKAIAKVITGELRRGKKTRSVNR
jgi:chromosome partitioning protein